MPNPEEYKGYQILGGNVRVILDGFGAFTLLASKFLLESGLGTANPDGVAVLELNTWYPLDAFLRAFDRIQAEFGEFTVRQAGRYIQKQATPPPGSLKDIRTAFLVDLNAGYHFNHAKNGLPLFNPQTGQITEGIGNFKSRPVPGKNQVICDADSAYPCAFQEGIILGFAQRFDPQATVSHDPGACRNKGAPACTYVVTWSHWR